MLLIGTFTLLIMRDMRKSLNILTPAMRDQRLILLVGM